MRTLTEDSHSSRAHLRYHRDRAQAIADTRDENTRLQAELIALKATRTFRYTRALRRLYRSLRERLSNAAERDVSQHA